MSLDNGPQFPGRVPPIWNVPARNLDFTGHGAILEKLRTRMTCGTGEALAAPAQAHFGLGGVGKTQLAIEHAHRFMADHDLVYWVSSERTDEITGTLAELARKLRLRAGVENVAEVAYAALEELRRDPPGAGW